MVVKETLMQIESYLGEERDGFFIQPMMKRVWYAQLEVLKEIDTICKRHRIKYFADWGTLLGAVRHHGFIPWDDDLDFAMLREDYDRFMYFAKQELPEGWLLLDIHDDGFDRLLARVTNGDTISVDKAFLDRFHGCPYIVGVDIFVLDRIPESKDEENVLMELFNLTYSVGINLNVWDEEPQSMTEALSEIEELTGYHFNEKISIKMQMLNLSEKIASMYWNSKSDEVTEMWYFNNHRGFRLPYSWFEKVIEVPFENMTIPIPENYDLILKTCYGENYMTPMRYKGHDYPFFRDQVEYLRKCFEEKGMKLPECFDICY